MTAYGIDYKIRGKEEKRIILIEAKDIKSAKNKIGRKHGYKNGKMVEVESYSVVGYF